MAETSKKRRKTTKASIEVAETLVKDVVEAVETRVEEAKIEEAKVSPIDETVYEAVVSKYEVKRKVRALVNARGVYGNYHYKIVQGETYEFPPEIAQWLMSKGRVH